MDIDILDYEKRDFDPSSRKCSKTLSMRMRKKIRKKTNKKVEGAGMKTSLTVEQVVGPITRQALATLSPGCVCCWGFSRSKAVECRSFRGSIVRSHRFPL